MKKYLKDRDPTNEKVTSSQVGKTLKPPIFRKAKLVVVDLAGSERIDKSGKCLQP